MPFHSKTRLESLGDGKIKNSTIVRGENFFIILGMSFFLLRTTASSAPGTSDLLGLCGLKSGITGVKHSMTGWTCDGTYYGPASYCTWTGVQCDDPINGPVTGILMNSSLLNGTLASSIGLLSSLTELSLSYNYLNGVIPTEIGLLTKLSWLVITSTYLEGVIPTEIGLLTKLSEISLGYNKLTGNIPTQLALLSSLTWLYLGKDSLSGTIPTQLGLMSNLAHMTLKGNQLTGVIPASLCQDKSLTYLHIYSNPGLTCLPACLSSIPDFNTDTSYDAEQAQCSSLQPSTSPSVRLQRTPTSTPIAPSRRPHKVRRVSRSPSSGPHRRTRARPLPA